MKNEKTFTIREVGTDINMFQTSKAEGIPTFVHKNKEHMLDTSNYFVENIDASVKVPLDIFLRDMRMNSGECEVILTYEELMQRMEEMEVSNIKDLDFAMWYTYGVDLCVRIETEDGLIKYNC